MIRYISDIFTVDQGINRKNNIKLLQQCAMCIDAIFRPFFGWNLNQPKKYKINFFVHVQQKSLTRMLKLK